MQIKIILSYSLFISALLCLLAATGAEQPGTSGKKPWPKDSNDTAAVEGAKAAFTASLKRSAQDRKFRDQLTASCESARQAVVKEGDIDIPDDVVIMFYEASKYNDHFAFYLPPLNEQAHTPYRFTDDSYLQCCSPSFRKFVIVTTDPTLGTALDATMTRAGYDPDFRKSLTVSCDSAKKGVSEEGHVQIKNEIKMMFHEDEKNEKYHVFSLPDFGEQNAEQYQYRKQFMCCYRVW
jgi:hypothetical protein